MDLADVVNRAGGQTEKRHSTAARVNLVVMDSFRERAQFIQKLLIPTSTDNRQLALFAACNERQRSRELVPVDFDRRERVSE